VASFTNCVTQLLFTDDEVESIETLDFGYSMKAFYIIPLLILALEDAIESILK
jgi:hypothetical protein